MHNLRQYYTQIIARAHYHHKKHWIPKNIRSFIIGALFLLIALYAQHLANTYVVALQGVAVDDLLLSHLPLLNIGGFLIQFSLSIAILIILCFVYKPKYLNFGLRALALFILIRSFFIILTHLGANPQQIVLSPSDIGFGLYNLMFNTSNDYFFSGHTGMPFLMGLIVWHERVWRYIFLITTLTMGVTMLIARMHYSIDVLAAPFITFSIFCIARFIFPHSYHLTKG
ncbi:MAG: phosphatase PAP2-related protein [bacterium]|nr:phosphatase PAP2-related protein [bacterium]